MTDEQRQWYERGRRDAWAYAARHLHETSPSWLARRLSWPHRLRCWLRDLSVGRPDNAVCDHWECNFWRDSAGADEAEEIVSRRNDTNRDD